MKSLIQFVYSGSCKINSQIVMELVLLSEKYKLTDLKVACLEFLTLNISKHTVLDLLFNANKKQHPIYRDVEKKCLKFIEENADDVFPSDDFAKLDEKTILSFLKAPKLLVDEIVLFKALIKWGKKRVEHGQATSLQDALKKFARLIRYPLISAEDLVTIVKPTGIAPPDLYEPALEYNTLTCTDQSKIHGTQFQERYITEE